MCLYQHYTSFSVLKTSWSRKEGLYCDCVPACTEPEYNIVTQESFGYGNRHKIVIQIVFNYFSTNFNKSVKWYQQHDFFDIIVKITRDVTVRR